MAFAGGESTGEAHEPDHDQDDRVGVAKIKIAATHLLQEKEHTDRYHNNGAAKTANGASLAVAVNLITHRRLTSRNALLSAAVHAVTEHENSHGN